MTMIEAHVDAMRRRVGKPTDVRIDRVELYFLPVSTRMPLRFGGETLTTVTCARVRIQVVDRKGQTAEGWGETPLSIQWTWPSISLPYKARYEAMVDFCRRLADAWWQWNVWGHPLEISAAFQRDALMHMSREFNEAREPASHLPYLAALVCCSAFDLALHDAYGILHQMPVFQTYNSQYMNCDLAQFLTPNEHSDVDFRAKYPADFLRPAPKRKLPVWHLVGGLDPLEPVDLTGDEPNDGYPVLIGDWIDRDGLYCLKVKLRGDDPTWDYNRLTRVGRIAQAKHVKWLSADFNCMVHEPAYINDILDRLTRDERHISDMILYVEQPFPYDLERYRIDVHSAAARKPLFMDESAHDWKMVKLGHTLGWNGVALKTCKTQTGALLSLCWAAAHGMSLMVQDLTNPMLAQIPHVLLAAHARTLMGVESNAMQFYPEASANEAGVHPHVYTRHDGELDLSTITGPGFGYRIAEISRNLPEPAVVCD